MTDNEEYSLLIVQTLLRDGKFDQAEKQLTLILKGAYPSLSANEIYNKASELQGKLNQKKKLRKNRIMLSSILALLGIVVGIMSEVEMRETNISAELHAKKLSFVPVNNFAIEKVLDFSAAELNIASLETDGVIQKYTIASREVKVQSGDVPIKVSSDGSQLSANLVSETLYLDNVEFDGLSQIYFSTLQPAKLRIGITKGNFTAELQSGDLFDLHCTNCNLVRQKGETASLSIISSDSIRLDGQGNSSMTFDKFKPVKSFLFDLVIKELYFFDDDQLKDESTITSGTVTFNDLQIDETKVKYGDGLKLSPGENFNIILLDVGDDIGLRVSGPVLKLSNNNISLMPSYLTYLYQSKTIVLYMGLLSVLVSIVWLVIQRFELLN